jgi:hypothetical protein
MGHVLADSEAGHEVPSLPNALLLCSTDVVLGATQAVFTYFQYENKRIESGNIFLFLF